MLRHRNYHSKSLSWEPRTRGWHGSRQAVLMGRRRYDKAVQFATKHSLFQFVALKAGVKPLQADNVLVTLGTP